MASRPSRFNPFMLVGIACILAALVGIALFLQAQRAPSVEILVPSGQIPAYTSLAPEQFTTLKMIKSEGTDGLLTRSQLDELRRSNPQGDVFSAIPLSPGQPILTENLLTEPTRSAKIVSPDERVIAVVADPEGAVGRNLSPGNVAEVQLAGNSSFSGGATATRAKIIATGSAEEIASVLEPGRKVPDTKTDGSLVILIAVPTQEAPALAGQKVSFALNTFCTVAPSGKIIPVTSNTNAAVCQ